ncbi:hypothetical protein Barb7_00169 [Bacteroidales bacterium Barb7]|nr:hypothetical protein Barb7_00169 [Bacteroidales bacterium Barb7]
MQPKRLGLSPKRFVSNPGHSGEKPKRLGEKPKPLGSSCVPFASHPDAFVPHPDGYVFHPDGRVTERATRGCPERARDFSPTWSAAECGVMRNDTRKAVLQGRYKLQMMVYNAIYIRSFFQNSTGSPFPLTPHFSLHVGLKSGILSGY